MYRYKGYVGRVAYSPEDAIWYGKLDGIPDLVTYEADSLEHAEAAFRSAVDDYLAFCADLGTPPASL